MRVMVYAPEEGVRRAIIVPGRRLKLAPVQVQGESVEDLAQEVAKVVRVVRGEEADPLLEELP